MEKLKQLYFKILQAIDLLDFVELDKLVKKVYELSLDERVIFFRIKEYENWFGTIMHACFRVYKTSVLIENYQLTDCEYLGDKFLTHEQSTKLNKAMVELFRMGGSLADLDHYESLPMTQESHFHILNTVVPKGFTKFGALWRGYKQRKELNLFLHAENMSDTFDFINELKFVPKGVYDILPNGGIEYQDGKIHFEKCIKCF